jgi:hypothetical protein
MKTSAEVQAGISRYLVEVATYLGSRTPQERREVLADLEAHIHEALAARGREPTQNDLEAVLTDMAPPESYAAGEEGPGCREVGLLARAGRLKLASWSLVLAIGGCVVPLALAAVLESLGRSGKTVGMLFPLLEFAALALAILATKRRERLGKVAVALAAILLVAGIALTA